LAVRCLDREATDDFFGQRYDFAALHQAVTDQPLLKGREQGVIRQAQFRHGAVAKTFGGDERQAAQATRVGAQMGHRFAAGRSLCPRRGSAVLHR
jgi:hypothetical protein